MDQETKDTISNIWQKMKTWEIKDLEVSFDGSGDEGEITDINYDGNDELKTLASLGSKMISDFEDEITNASEVVLADTSYDWVNDTGGYGTVVWNLEEKTIQVNMTGRILTEEEKTFVFNQEGHSEEAELRTIFLEKYLQAKTVEERMQISDEFDNASS